MNHCESYLELLSASLDGALSPAEQEKLEAHLAACPECRKARMELEAVHAALQNLPAAEPPAGLYDRIMEAVAADNVVPFAPPAKKKPAFRWQKWAAAAAMFAVLMVGYGSVKGPDKGAELLPVSPEPTVEAAIGSDSLPQGRSMDAQNEVDAIQAFSEDEEPTTDAAVAPMTVSQPPVSGDTAPPPTPAPPFKSAGPTEETPPEPQPTAMVRSFMATALPAEETPGEGEEETIDTLDITPFALPIPEGTGDEEENSVETSLLTGNGIMPEVNESDAAKETPEVVESKLTDAELTALERVVEYMGYTDPYTWDTPYTIVWGRPEAPSPEYPDASTALTFEGLSENGKYYLFVRRMRIYGWEPNPDEWHHSIWVENYAVPVDGGDIVDGAGDWFDALLSE